MRIFLPWLISLFLVISCSKDNTPKGNFVAKIDNILITKEDVYSEINSLPDYAKEFFEGEDGKIRFVDELVKKELLYMEAKKRGLDKDKDLQRKIEEFKKITLINKLLENEVGKNLTPSENDMKTFYEKNKDEFTINNQVRLSHIIVKNEIEAEKIFERLKRGEEFSKVALEVSLDKASARSGGDIGSFKKGELAPDIESVVFPLKKGEISIPIKLKDGIHIFKVTDSKGTVIEYEKVKNLIAQKIIAEKQKESFDKLIDNLKNNKKIEINKEEISRLSFSKDTNQK